MAGFPETRGSMIANLASPSTADRARGLETLAAAYWKPVYTYVRFRWNRPHEDAADLTQEFFARVVEKDLLARHDASRARLRTYLRVCVDGFVANELKAAGRQKRGGDAVMLSLDLEDVRNESESALSRATASPEEVFEREWTRSVFTLSVARLRAFCETRRKTSWFALFSASDLEEDPRPSYADLASRFDLSVTDVTNHLAAVRREFRRCVLGILRELTASDEELRREARALLGVDLPT